MEGSKGTASQAVVVGPGSTLGRGEGRGSKNVDFFYLCFICVVLVCDKVLMVCEVCLVSM